jgi:hypothetical protein
MSLPEGRRGRRGAYAPARRHGKRYRQDLLEGVRDPGRS